MRRSFRRGRGRRRSVAWIPGFQTSDTVANQSSRLVTLAQLSAAAPNTWGAAFGMTTDADLSLHGGEDAVITRIRGDLFFSDGSVNTGAGAAVTSFQIRCVFAVSNITPGGATMPFDFTTSAGLGNDNILWTGDAIVPSIATAGVAAGMDAILFPGRSLCVDVKAKRKLQSDSQLVMWFQRVVPAGTIGASFVLRGGLRMLLMRSR